MVARSRIKFVKVAGPISKTRAETMRGQYKRSGARYTQVKKSPYGGYDLLISFPMSKGNWPGKVVKKLGGSHRNVMKSWPYRRADYYYRAELAADNNILDFAPGEEEAYYRLKATRALPRRSPAMKGSPSRKNRSPTRRRR